MLSFDLTEGSLVVGNEEQNDSGVRIYPNPASSHVVIQSLNGISKVRIHSLDGRLINAVEPFNSQTLKVDTHTLPGGLYFVEIETPSGVLFFSRLIIRN